MSITTWGHSNYRCKIKPGWEGAGRQGNAYGLLQPDSENDNGAQKWLIVRWDDEEDPECFKAAGTLIRYRDQGAWREP